MFHMEICHTYSGNKKKLAKNSGYTIIRNNNRKVRRIRICFLIKGKSISLQHIRAGE